MCGIFGEFGRLICSKEEFERLNAINSRRGPDADCIWSNDLNCRLGFRRLAILDTSENGVQPMHSMNGDFLMVMNGEVYNYEELWIEIGKPILKSHSDSEVVVNVIEKFGLVEGVKKLNGMFAIAIYDFRKSHLHLIRDFAGVKPLYYGVYDNTVVFGSSYDQIFQHPLIKTNLTPNLEALSDYLLLGYIPAPNAFFKSTFQVLPGQIISFDLNGDVKETIYFELNSSDHGTKETSKNALDHSRKAVMKAVKEQLVSDVPLGTFLSGGIDSPLINAYAIINKPDIAAFTVGSDHESFDESNKAKEYAAKLEICHYLKNFSRQDLRDAIDEHFLAYSEPFGDWSSLPTFLVSKMAKEHFTVILSGDGGDEVFWGYPRFLNYVSHLNWFKWPLWWRKAGAFFQRKLLKRKISYGILKESLGQWVFAGQMHNYAENVKTFFPMFKISNETNKLYSFTSTGKTKTNVLNWLKWNEFYGHLQRVLLKVDRSSMYHSLEVRVPFLDKQVLIASGEIEPELGIKHTSPKFILKELLKEQFPEDIINLDKMGFSVEMDSLLRKDLRPEIMSIFFNGDIYPSNTFDLPKLREYISSYLDGKSNNGWGIWILFSLQKWAINYGLNSK